MGRPGSNAAARAARWLGVAAIVLGTSVGALWSWGTWRFHDDPETGEGFAATTVIAYPPVALIAVVTMGLAFVGLINSTRSGAGQKDASIGCLLGVLALALPFSAVAVASAIV